MKLLKILGVVLVLLVIVFVGGGFLLPAEMELSRSETVEAPPAVVFEYVNDLEKYNEWSPWNATDPDIEIEYGEQTRGEGASFSWNSEKHGAGSLTVAKSVAPESVETRLDFGPQGGGTGWWTFEPASEGEATEVTWGMTAEAEGLTDRWMGLLMSKMVGPQFEQGLAAMKALAEAAPEAEESDTAEGEGGEEDDASGVASES